MVVVIMQAKDDVVVAVVNDEVTVSVALVGKDKLGVEGHSKLLDGDAAITTSMVVSATVSVVVLVVRAGDGVTMILTLRRRLLNISR